MKSSIFLLIFIFLFIFSLRCNAQLLPPASQVPVSECDYCGCAQGISPIETGSTGVRVEFNSLNLGNPYQGSDKQPNPLHQKEIFLTERASLYYRFANSSFTASVEIPYVQRQSEEPADDGSALLNTSKASGVGDVIARLRYTDQANVDESMISYSAAFGIQLPTGQTDLKSAAGEFLDPDLEPGAGTTNFLISASGFWSYARIAVGANIGVGILTGKGAPEEAGAYHKYGNFLTGDLSFRYRILPAEISESNLSITLALGAETRGHETQGGEEIGSSGGSIIYISPGLKYIVSQSVSADAQFHVPIYQYLGWDPLGETQMGESYRFVAGLQFIL